MSNFDKAANERGNLPEGIQITALLDNIEEGIVWCDGHGSAHYANEFANNIGLSVERINDGVRFYDKGQRVLLPEESPIAASLRGEAVENREYWLMEPGKAVVIMLISCKRDHNVSGSVAGLVMLVHDITVRKWAEQRLAVSEQRYKSLFDNNPDAVCWIDLKGQLLSANPAASALTGLTLNQLRGRHFRHLFTFNGARKAMRHFRSAARGESQYFELELELSDQSRRSTNVTAVPIVVDGHPAGLFVIIQDITTRKESERTIYHLAYHDKLTGLPNRMSFQLRLQQLFSESSAAREPLALLFIDLDRFKVVNDTLGHHIGDLLLTGVAHTLRSQCDSDATLYRLGGDEFTLLLTGGGSERAEETARQLIRCMEKPMQIYGHELFAVPSIGISLYPEDGDTDELLLKRADIAMYHAKSLGNQYRFYDKMMEMGLSRRLDLEQGLRRALEREQFCVYYQPQVQIESRRIVGAEALIRWEHPELGMLSPGEFISIAEETGLIVPIGEWMLREACRTLKRWCDLGFDHMRMAVNLSARQFQDPELQSKIEKVLAEFDIQPSQLEVEITEGVAMQNVRQVVQIMQNLKQTGIQIALDDFGTGYSSLSYLKTFPIDKIKIDRSFINNLTHDPRDMAIVTAVNAMAGGLLLDVVAEGVEQEEQLEVLRQMGCRIAQGYLIARPMPAERFERIVLGVGDVEATSIR